jgi:agmatine deiminase
MSKTEIEEQLKRYLGVRSIIWLDRGVHNDETDGHIDNLACFARPGVMLLTWTDDRDDPQYAISKDAFERLSHARDAKGRALDLVKLPQPGPLFMTADEAQGVDTVEGTEPRVAGARLAGSYVNFYVCNDAIILPLLDSKHDAQAVETVSRVFPGRRVKGVDAREILLGGGNIHCILQQQPAAR